MRLMAVAGLSVLAAQAAVAAPIYLNDQNMTVELISPAALTGGVVGNVIDAPSADAVEFHNQTSHVWVASGPATFRFDLLTDYDLGTFHFWNYHSFGFQVAHVGLEFFDVSNQSLGTFEALPVLGGTPDANDSDSTPILAQDFGLDVSDVRFVTAVLTGGSSGQVDFQNIGFTALLSDPGTEQDPVLGVAEPAAFGLLAAGFAGLALFRRRAGAGLSFGAGSPETGG